MSEAVRECLAKAHGLRLEPPKDLKFENGSYSIGPHRLRGAHQILKAWCPHYDPVVARGAARRAGAKLHTVGMRVGALVDDQVSTIVKLAGIDPKRYRLADALAEPPVMLDGVCEIWRADVEALHPLARKALLYLHENGYEPVTSQTLVARQSARAATETDLVVKRDGALYVVELKAGFVGTLDAACGKMAYPFHELDDSPRNRICFQAMLGQRLLLSCTAKGSATSAYNVRKPKAAVDVGAFGLVVQPGKRHAIPLELPAQMQDTKTVSCFMGMVYKGTPKRGGGGGAPSGRPAKRRRTVATKK